MLNINKNHDLIKMAEETKKLTAMVVEDEKEANRLLSSTFANFFSDVYSVYGGREGLAQFKKYQPDIVFIDIIMPDMDGLTLAREIRRINKNQIIVIISASNDISKVSETIEIGVNSFIQKPISTEKIIELLSGIIELIKRRKKIETKTFSISLPLDVYDLVDTAAKAESISKNAIVIRALRKFFNITIN
jgi:YesN/AraC family two-component response regulator